MTAEGRNGLLVESAAGAAATAGVRAGDRILLVEGQPPVDVLDVELAAADGTFSLKLSRAGAEFESRIEVRAGEHHGIGLAGGLGVPIRRCANACRFCFVDQLPLGLRRSLYVKDDDYRLSFLQGSFITLTNMSEGDLRRIEALRLSPLYVSLHVWDDDRRRRLMGERALESRARLLRLSAAGIEAHLQVVLCPGWNDGEALAETLDALAVLPGILDVGVVPVSAKPGHRVRPVSPTDGEEAIEIIERRQEPLRRRTGRAVLHAADELYLLAGRLPPPSDADCQYENGVGMVAAFNDEVEHLVGVRNRPSVALLTGTLAEPVVRAACQRLGAARPFVVQNALFGPHVTVTGLLGGREVLAALERRPLAEVEWLLAPAAFLPAHLGLTLDDVAAQTIDRACEGRLIVASDLSEAFARLPA